MKAIGIRLHRPLVPPSVAAAALDLSEDRVRALVESGAIEYAFDLRTKLADRQCLRVFAPCLLVAQGAAEAGAWETLPAVIAECIPPPPNTPPTAHQLALAFSLDPQTLHIHLRQRSLERVRGSVTHRGSSGSPRITLESIRAFLKERRVL